MCFVAFITRTTMQQIDHMWFLSESFAITFFVAVLARIKVSFTDTIIRLEHLPKNTKAGIAVEIHIKG